MELSSLESVIQDLQKGIPVIVVDDENRENEGDIVFPASKVNADLVKLLVNEARGLICTPMTQEIAQKLDLPLMVYNNNEQYKTAFTVSVDAATGVSTGISVQDRAKVISVLGDPTSTKMDIRRPGHVFPLIAKEGGVLERQGHTEASVDLLKLAGLYPVAVICEILNKTGDMARLSSTLKDFALEHGLKIISIKQIIEHRLKTEQSVVKVSEANLPTRFGNFKIVGFKSQYTQEEAVIIVKGEIDNKVPLLMRVHSQCLTGDVFHSLKCDCGDQMDYAMKKIQEEGRGMIIYLFQEGRGIGILSKIQAYALQDQGFDTVEANLKLGLPSDARDYSIAYGILKHYGIQDIRLLSNNPLKLGALENLGINVKREPVIVQVLPEREGYMNIKQAKMGHMLDEL